LESPSVNGESAATGSADANGSSRQFMGEDVARSPSVRHADDPDFKEVGLDAESRFRRLRMQYIAAMEEQERLVEEQKVLQGELDKEKQRRRDAEEAERLARAEMRLAEESRDHVKEEQKALFELRLDQESQSFAQRLRQREKEIEDLREDLSAQAVAAENVSAQLDLCKQKLQEQQEVRKENEELKGQIEELLSRSSSSAGEHLVKSLARSREDTAMAVREREDLRQQLDLLQQTLAREQQSRNQIAEELETLRSRQLEGVAAANGEASDPASASHKIGQELNARAVGNENSSSQASSEGRAEEFRKLLESQKDSLLERLLSEKERATTAETKLQSKVNEVTALTEQRKGHMARIAALEEEAHVARTSPETADVEIREMQKQIALRDREVQFLRMRGQADKDCMIGQEALMAACFHELGMKYQALRLEHHQLQRSLAATDRDPSPIKNSNSLD